MSDLFEEKKIKKLKKKIKQIKKERKRVIINSVKHEITKIFREAQLAVQDIDIVVGKHNYYYGEDTPILVNYEIYNIKCFENRDDKIEITVVCIEDWEPLVILDGYADIPQLWEGPITEVLDRISDDSFQVNAYTYSFSVKDKIYKFIAINTAAYLNNDCKLPGKHSNNVICKKCKDLYTYSHNHPNCVEEVITLSDVEWRLEYQNQIYTIIENIYDLYYHTKTQYTNYPIYEYRCRALLILLSQRHKNGTFSILPKDIAVLIAKKVYDFKYFIM